MLGMKKEASCCPKGSEVAVGMKTLSACHHISGGTAAGQQEKVQLLHQCSDCMVAWTGERKVEESSCLHGGVLGVKSSAAC